MIFIINPLSVNVYYINCLFFFISIDVWVLHAFYKFNQVFLIIKRNFSWFQMRIQSNNWIGFSKYYSRHFVFSDYIVFLNFLSSTKSKGFLKIKSKGFLKLSLIWFSLQTPAKKRERNGIEVCRGYAYRRFSDT